MIEILREVRPHVTLRRDSSTGIAFVTDGTTGISHSAHPNIAASGSPTGMVKLGYWAASDRTVKSHGWIYNIDLCVVHEELDRLAADNCQCGGRHTWGRPT